MIRILLLMIAFSSCVNSYAQFHDNLWDFGKYQREFGWGMASIDFENTQKPNIDFTTEKIDYVQRSSLSMSDHFGERVYYTNGEKIYTKFFDIMENGDSLNMGLLGDGSTLYQGLVSFPRPSSSHQYILCTMQYIGIEEGSELYMSRIDMSKNNGLGGVVEKRVFLLDSLSYGGLTAAKHANGRDWWVIAHTIENSDLYYSILVTPDTFMINSYHSGVQVEKGIGIYQFTPDGAKYFMADGVDIFEAPSLTVFDFDRCTGQLYNGQKTWIPYDQQYYLVGSVSSSNSRFLYYFNEYKAYQFDLEASDIFGSRVQVAEWDSSYYGIVRLGLFNGHLASDGKIYVNSNNGAISLHRIEYPNRKGLACGFRQNRINLPAIRVTEMPNHPNYRLGAIDGNTCDTLGIDNHPLARWRYDIEDSNQPLSVTFTDLTDYEPTSWVWEFGDGTLSQERYPMHTYDVKDIYEVCLIACNANSCDTLCKEVDLLTEAAPIIVDFDYQILDDLEVEFTDSSNGNDWVRWSWGYDFLESSLDNPTHTFPDTGTYTVCQMACTPFECDTLCKEIYLGGKINIPITAAWTFTPIDDYLLNFTDQSQSDSIISWTWHFGDSQTSNAQNPNHTYTTAGIYEVCLEVCSPTACDTFCQEINVQDPLPIFAHFGYAFEGLDSIFFQEQSQNGAITWFWDFGDGQTSTEQNPMHVYGTSGVYEVCLTVCDSLGACAEYCDEVVVVLSSSVSLNKKRPSIKLHPNPSNEILWITKTTEDPLRLVIRDVLGRVVYVSDDFIGKKKAIVTIDFPEGQYFIEAIGPRSGGVVLRFVVVH